MFNEFKNMSIKGEWVVIVEPKQTFGFNLDLDDIISLDIAPKIKAKLIAKMTGQSIKEVYQQFLDRIPE